MRVYTPEETTLIPLNSVGTTAGARVLQSVTSWTGKGGDTGGPGTMSNSGSGTCWPAVRGSQQAEGRNGFAVARPKCWESGR